METIVAPPISQEALRLAFSTGPLPAAIPENWTFKINWKAFMNQEDWNQAKRIESSGSLDAWLDPKEDVYEK